MDELRYTLVADGSSDKALLPILTWLLKHSGVACPIQAAFADLAKYRKTDSLSDKIKLGLHFYECDLLFVHRDAEREPREKRLDEIRNAIKNLPKQIHPPAYVCVIPVRMQETWLLIDVEAVRLAAGNPNGSTPISLPKLSKLESIPDPKKILHDLLIAASGRTGRKLSKYSPRKDAVKIANFIDDFSPLKCLPAFQALREDLTEALKKMDLQLQV